jgi:hypothetical protein
VAAIWQEEDAMNESNHQVAQGGHNLQRIACAQPRAIFPKGHIAYVVQRVLNAPMAPYQFQQA